MRGYQKRQLLDIIESLHMLHKESRDKLDRKDYQTVQTALADCQEAAIQMGEAIERMAGEETEAVMYLEQYCEKIYQLNIQLMETTAKKYYKILESSLIKAENAVLHLTVRKEIVFFPYKASMWDSLESVYFAAKEDKQCDVYVVPIPYYEKNSDGNLGHIHYERNEYPENIKTTDYRSYDLEERHPDVIYIHNPYDEWNNVTSVPERYYAKNLRNYTDCLVYIPYFILGEIESNDPKAVEGMRHFCFIPGVIYAHKVIVQSEKMREIYIREYLREAQKLGIPASRKVMEQKILGIGSPKLDKVHGIQKENVEIPESWMYFLKRQDGTWKKVIFYNTSINALLRYEDKIFQKMESVFQLFQKRSDETVLLWRPHPLIPGTIKSMRPNLWTAYQNLVDTYRKEKWGIYDDTADMDRAVMISDAYFGDYSSVVSVYQETGKPVMLQSVIDGQGLDILGKAYAFGAAVDGDYIYMQSPHYDLLFMFSRTEKRMVSYIKLNEDIRLYNRSMSQIMVLQDNICVIPYYDDSIYVISKQNRSIHKIGLKKNNVRCAFAGCKVNGKIWVLPLMNHEFMYSLDENGQNLKEFPSVFKIPDLPDDIISEYGHPVFTKMKVTGAKIWFAVRFQNLLFCYDTVSAEWEKYYVNVRIKDFIFAEEKCWILSDEDTICLWKQDKGLCVECRINKEVIHFGENRTAFLYITYQAHSLWCLPDFGDSIFIYDLNTEEEKYIRLLKDYKKERLCSWSYEWHENVLYIFSADLAKIWSIDVATYEVNTVELNLPKEIQKKLITAQGSFNENNMSLETFLSYMGEAEKKEMKEYQNAGKAIHEQIVC